MPAIRGLTVSVGQWYARTLEVCLVRNMRHLTRCLVVTAPGDPAVAVARSVPNVEVLETDAFTRHGARFNKGLAMEEGFERLGRSGWLAIFDADIVWPDAIPLDRLRSHALHGCRRRVLDDPAAWRPDIDARRLPLINDKGPIGFTQIFHADAPYLAGKRPWYDVSFAHAGGGDAYFLSLFPRERWVTLPVESIHLGPVDRHWFGTDAEAKELMAAFVKRNNWRRAINGLPPGAGASVGEIRERVEVPGYAPSTYELPFVKRAREQTR